MSDGPTALYDKSAIQLLSREEARWFTHFFRGVITPVFLTESLGNLAKEFGDKRDSSKVVAAMAAKIQGLGSLPNVPHTELIEMNLLGYPVEMRGVPVVGGAQPVQNADGEWGVFIDESPEEKALHRWRAGNFSDGERERASGWRRTTKSFDLQPLVRSMNEARREHGDLSDAPISQLKRGVEAYFGNEATQFKTLSSALEAFDVSPKFRAIIKKRWVALGRPPFSVFAPYASFSLNLTMTFLLGVSSRCIPERPTNVVDLQYLYYLPFCQVFTSGDKLHRDFAAAFMGPSQQFIWAQDLKKALAEFVAYYEGHKDALLRQGMMNFARFPPLELHTVIHDVYDALRPRWRKEALIPKEPISPEESARIMAKLKPMIESFEKAARRKSSFDG